MNGLAGATSPYLLQHADNPVDWFPWGVEALNLARQQGKPIFLSIGYAACHWCHVMAHESFENHETAAIMNRHFVNIKVDREERPDLDGIYMQAAVAMTGSGGWPLSVFLNLEFQPFYAGTYFPPVARFSLPSFREVLLGIARAWEEDRDHIDQIGADLSQRLRQQTDTPPPGRTWTRRDLDSAEARLVETYDWAGGGWGEAPKFPQPMALEFLLARLATRRSRSVEAARLVTHCLRAMLRGGFYDVVGGGFARYSTDSDWKVPHFEKMLYDNALLARAYLHGWQVLGDAQFLDIAIQVLDFMLEELRHPSGGFYSSLDADSPGGEGAFYAWEQGEIRDILGAATNFFEAAYGITARGNWEGKTILHRAIDDATLAAKFGLDAAAAASKLRHCHEQLYAARSKRAGPAADTKILASWNGLALVPLAEAARCLPEERLRRKYLEAATETADFLMRALRADGRLHRAQREGSVSPQVFLEDYASLVNGLLELYQTDFDLRWFEAAAGLAQEMTIMFRAPDGGFFDTPEDGESLLLRPRELQDNATPSGNGLACAALLKLSALSGKADLRAKAEAALGLVTDLAPKYPTAFAQWLGAAEFALGDTKEVALVGIGLRPGFDRLLDVVRSTYRPNVVIAAGDRTLAAGRPALLENRAPIGGKSTAFVCRDFTCQLPTADPAELRTQLDADP